MKIYINNFLRCRMLAYRHQYNARVSVSWNDSSAFLLTEPLTSSSVFLSPHSFIFSGRITTSDIWSYHKCAVCAGGYFFETEIIFADIGIRFSRPHNFLSAFYFINSWNGYMFPPLSPGHRQIHFIWNDLMMTWWKRSKHVVAWTVCKI